MAKGPITPTLSAARATGRRRVAIVIPVVDEVLGNRHALLLASGLTRFADVDLFVSTATESAVAELRQKCGTAVLHVETVRQRSQRSMLKFLISQLVPWHDAKLSRRLRAEGARRPFDAVLVFANEGHGIARRLRDRSAPGRPLMAVCVMELPDYIFTLAADRSHPRVRRLLAPLLRPILHAVEARKLAAFDRCFANSQWTLGQLEALYGVRGEGSLAVTDLDWFVPDAGAPVGLPSRYVAVPTASWVPEWDAWAERLRGRDVAAVAFGPHRVPHLQNLGFVTDEELRRVLGGAAATLFLFDYEALGLMPLESLACGTPVITLPKEGPWAELRGNPHVTFVRTAEEAVERAAAAMHDPPDAGRRQRIRESTAPFAPDTVTRWLAHALLGNSE